MRIGNKVDLVVVWDYWTRISWQDDLQKYTGAALDERIVYWRGEYHKNLKTPIVDASWHDAEIVADDLDVLFIRPGSDWHLLGGKSGRVKEGSENLDPESSHSHTKRHSENILKNTGHFRGTLTPSIRGSSQCRINVLVLLF